DLLEGVVLDDCAGWESAAQGGHALALSHQFDFGGLELVTRAAVVGGFIGEAGGQHWVAPSDRWWGGGGVLCPAFWRLVGGRADWRPDLAGDRPRRRPRSGGPGSAASRARAGRAAGWLAGRGAPVARGCRWRQASG